MHKDQIRGAMTDAKGAAKRAVGKATGDQRIQAAGAADQAAGKVRKGLGDLKQAVRDALKR